MYIPTHFHETDLTRLDWLAAHDAFGTLVSTVEGAPFATHVPVLYQREGNKVLLIGHWAKSNPQWQTIEEQSALFIFHGPHAYVSPRWYAQPQLNVPTWNYAAAHLYGRVKVFHEAERLGSIVAALAQHFESEAAQPWRFADSSAGQKVRGIVGFELIADRIELKFKLNQNRGIDDISGAIAALSARNTDDARAVAELMTTSLAKRDTR